MKTEPSSLSPDDAWVESLLRDQPSDYIDDAGFSARVVQALPRTGRRRRWLLAGATATGCAIAAAVAGPDLASLGRQASATFAMQIERDPLLPACALIAVCLTLAATATWRAFARLR